MSERKDGSFEQSVDHCVRKAVFQCVFPQIKMLIAASPVPTQPNHLLLNECCLKQIVDKLPSFGTISCDESSKYWYILLPKEWQNATWAITNKIRDEYGSTKWYQESEALGQYWFNLINFAVPQHTKSCAKINTVTPPSLVGMLIQSICLRTKAQYKDTQN